MYIKYHKKIDAEVDKLKNQAEAKLKEKIAGQA